MISNFLGMIAGLVYSFGGIIPFIPQYQRIQRKRSDRGFSTTVCLILLIANILRIEFWMLKRFSIALLLQSLSMITAQLMLLELCIRVRSSDSRDKLTVGESLGLQEMPSSKRKTDKQAPKRFWNNPLGTNFWAWPNFADYVGFVVSFSVATLIRSLVP